MRKSSEYLVVIERTVNSVGRDVLMLCSRDPCLAPRISGGKAMPHRPVSQHRCRFTQQDLDAANLIPTAARKRVARGKR